MTKSKIDIFFFFQENIQLAFMPLSLFAFLGQEKLKLCVASYSDHDGSTGVYLLDK